VWFAHICVTLYNYIYMYIYVHPKIWVRHQSLEPLSLPLQEARAAAAEVAELRGVAPWVLQTTHFTYPRSLRRLYPPGASSLVGFPCPRDSDLYRFSNVFGSCPEFLKPGRRSTSKVVQGPRLQASPQAHIYKTAATAGSPALGEGGGIGMHIVHFQRVSGPTLYIPESLESGPGRGPARFEPLGCLPPPPMC
jgi:hypothetical protein